MPGKYSRIADVIARTGAEGGLSPADIGKIISGCGTEVDLPTERNDRNDDMRPLGGGSPPGADSPVGVNLYPSDIPCNTCYPLAIFVALEGRLKKPHYKRHLNFDRMLFEFRRHFDICPQTREAVIITDTWHASTYDQWRPCIEKVAVDGVYLEFYLIGPRWVSELFPLRKV